MKMMLFIPTLLLGAGVLGVSGIRPQHVVPPVRPMASIPDTMQGLPGRDVVIDSVERRVAGMSDYVLREFVADSTVVFSVYLGYYDRQVQGKTIHSPRNCLPGAGWEILQSSPMTIAATPIPARVNRVLLANKGVKALVYYWYQGRGRVESSEYTVKWDLLRDAALYGRTEETLVRIVVPVARTRATDRVGTARAIAAADSVALHVGRSLVGVVQQVLPAAPGVM
jgi:EpsI family protein